MRRSSFTGFIKQIHLDQRQNEDSSVRPIPTILLDSKLSTYKFATGINIPTPEVQSHGRRIGRLKYSAPCVIKPMGEDSARGVFICRSDDDIFEVTSGITYTSFRKMRQRADHLMKRQVVKNDRWIAETLLLKAGGEMAKDIKFYCFYGRAPLALETRREPSIARCWYGDDGEVTSTGKYTDSLFDGTGYEPEARLFAEAISLHIPFPFVRVDLLIGERGIFLGELTPIPGNFNKFDAETDRRLGDEISAATIRLAKDVSYGKIFADFSQFKVTRGFAL